MFEDLRLAAKPRTSRWNTAARWGRISLPMKTVFFLILSLAALAVVGAVFIFDVFTESGGHASDSYSLKAPFASRGMTREEYISYLLKTEKHDDPELWRRIAAVKQRPDWPK